MFSDLESEEAPPLLMRSVLGISREESKLGLGGEDALVLVITDFDADMGRGRAVVVAGIVSVLTGRISATLQSGSSISDWMKFPACRVA